MVPNEEIAELGPGSTLEGDLYVDFQHQLTAVKLVVVVNGSSYPVKLSPEVGFLLRPLQLTAKAFSSAESEISGMHESSRRFAVTSVSSPLLLFVCTNFSCIIRMNNFLICSSPKYLRGLKKCAFELHISILS